MLHEGRGDNGQRSRSTIPFYQISREIWYGVRSSIILREMWESSTLEEKRVTCFHYIQVPVKTENMVVCVCVSGGGYRITTGHWVVSASSRLPGKG